MAQTSLGEQVLLELRQISRRLSALEAQLPIKDWVWLPPAEMSKLAGVTPRTLQNYVLRGRLSPRTFKREQRGKSFTYKYHRELTLKELGLI